MRFRGGGIGHKATRERMGDFCNDLHTLAVSEDDVDELTGYTVGVADGEIDEEEDEDNEEEDEDSEERGESEDEEGQGEAEAEEEGWEDEYDVMGYGTF